MENREWGNKSVLTRRLAEAEAGIPAEGTLAGGSPGEGRCSLPGMHAEAPVRWPKVSTF